MWKINKKEPKHVDTFVNSIQTLPFPITSTLSNTHNNPRPQVDFFENNLSTYYCSEQDVFSNKISYSYDHTSSYTTDSVFFKELNCVYVLICL